MIYVSDARRFNTLSKLSRYLSSDQLCKKVKSSPECVNPRRLDHFKLEKVKTAVLEICDVNDYHVSSTVFENIVHSSLEIVPRNDQVYHPINSTVVSEYYFYLLGLQKLPLDQLYISCNRSHIDKLEKFCALIN
jgi:hypothetical protein